MAVSNWPFSASALPRFDQRGAPEHLASDIIALAQDQVLVARALCPRTSRQQCAANKKNCPNSSPQARSPFATERDHSQPARPEVSSTVIVIWNLLDPRRALHERKRSNP